jgi:exosortase F-associated protein
MTRKPTRVLLGIISILGLIIVFIFQRFDYSAFVGFDFEFIGQFLFNRTVRFVLNDFLMITMIFALFPQKKYVIFALWVQLAGIIFILFPYFLLKIYFPYYNGPLISYLHRLILNPTLLLLLIPAFYYQKRTSKQD